MWVKSPRLSSPSMDKTTKQLEVLLMHNREGKQHSVYMKGTRTLSWCRIERSKRQLYGQTLSTIHTSMFMVVESNRHITDWTQRIGTDAVYTHTHSPTHINTHTHTHPHPHTHTLIHTPTPKHTHTTTYYTSYNSIQSPKTYYLNTIPHS